MDDDGGDFVFFGPVSDRELEMARRLCDETLPLIPPVPQRFRDSLESSGLVDESFDQFPKPWDSLDDPVQQEEVEMSAVKSLEGIQECSLMPDVLSLPRRANYVSEILIDVQPVPPPRATDDEDLAMGHPEASWVPEAHGSIRDASLVPEARQGEGGGWKSEETEPEDAGTAEAPESPPQISNETEEAAGSDDKFCQTSFAYPLSSGIPKLTGSGAAPKASKVPRPVKRALPTSSSATPKSAIPVPRSMARKRCTPTSKYSHIRSPIAQYIHDVPAPPLVRNVRSKTKAKLRYSEAEKPKGTKVALPEPDDARCQDEDAENMPPPLPYVLYKGSDAIACVENKSEHDFVPPATTKLFQSVAPNTPVVIKHTGQRKKIRWAPDLVGPQSGKALSPKQQPVNVRPTIRLKPEDMDQSDVNDSRAIDVSIVELCHAQRTNTLRK